MNLLTAKNKVLMLIDVYSKNGIIQDPNGTKLKNYSYKMTPFFDMAQKQIATVKKIETLYTVDVAPSTDTDYYVIPLPGNCYQMGYVESENEKISWNRKGKSSISISSDTVFPIDITYYRYPADIDNNTSDSYEFEIDADAQEALTLYVASQLMLNENNAIGDRLMSQFNNWLANLDTTIPTGNKAVINTLFSMGV